MSTNRHFLSNLWRWKCGLAETEFPKTEPLIDIKELHESQWSGEFENYMHNRLILGAIRYGKLNQQGKPKYDRVNTMRKKIDLYEKTGNKECLVDLANYAMVEFIEPSREGTYFEATDDQHHDTVIG